MDNAKNTQPSAAALLVKPLTSPHRIRQDSLIIAVCMLLTPAVQLLCCPGSFNGSCFQMCRRPSGSTAKVLLMQALRWAVTLVSVD